MIKEAIQKVVNRQNLSEEEAIAVMTEIMSGQATEAQISAYITALRMKGETIEEITGSAKVMREFAIKVDRKENLVNKVIVDTCGTGGDGLKTFNISTVTAFVVAGAAISMRVQINPFMGVEYLVIALVITALGGLGNPVGSLVGAILYALMDSAIGYLLPPGLKLFYLYTLFLLILLVRPTGIMGRPQIVR